jgi:hypothetical protein
MPIPHTQGLRIPEGQGSSIGAVCSRAKTLVLHSSTIFSDDFLPTLLTDSRRRLTALELRDVTFCGDHIHNKLQRVPASSIAPLALSVSVTFLGGAREQCLHLLWPLCSTCRASLTHASCVL